MRISDFPRHVLKCLIFLYRYAVSPLTGATCRFYPTCSAYAIEALDLHGVMKGSILSFRRLLKCHPWHKGKMIDPVPASIDWATLIGYNSRDPEHQKNCGCGHTTKKD